MQKVKELKDYAWAEYWRRGSKGRWGRGEEREWREERNREREKERQRKIDMDSDRDTHRDITVYKRVEQKGGKPGF